MGKPFQFSMLRMFCAVALMAIALRLFVLLIATRFEGGILTLLLYFSVFAIGGAALGCVAGNSSKGAIYGAFCGFVIGIVLGATLFPVVNAARE